MICPKCKGKNSKEDITCQHCDLKLKTICPRCKHPNALGQPKCVNCNLILIRFCSQCKAPNFPQAKNCRRCGAQLVRKRPQAPSPETKQPEIKQPKPVKQAAQKPEIKTVEIKTPKPRIQPQEVETPKKSMAQPIPEPVEIKQATPPGIPEIQTETIQTQSTETKENYGADLKKELTRNEAIKAITNVISVADKGYLLSLCAPEGLGKSTVISAASQNLKDEKITWLNGFCEPYKQNIPYSYLKDMIRNAFGIPVISLNNEELKKSLKKAFETNLGITDSSILKTIYKLVLNEYGDFNSSIEKNREEIHKAAQEIITALNKKNRIVMIVEDFEYIDKSSFDCIKYLLKKNFLDNKNFLIINHTPRTNIAKLFPAEISLQRLIMLHIKPLTPAEMDSVLLSMLNNQEILPEELKSRIFRQSKGMPIYVEQALWFLFQMGVIVPDNKGLAFNPQFKDIEISPDLAEIFMQRLSLIEKMSPDSIKVILTAALFGIKFIPKLVELATGIKEKEMQPIIQLLINNGIFVVYDQYNFGFKHLYLWKILYERVFNDQQIKECSANILSILKENPNVSSSMLAKLAEMAEDQQSVLNYCNNAVTESFALGDPLSYTNNQVKLLELLDVNSIKPEEKANIKITITEQIGKVNFEANPTLAISYLKESIKTQEELDNKVKVVELTGYLSRSCELSGNYQGVLDCAEKAINIAQENEENESEIMLLNYSKLSALFNLGRLEETIMSAENEVLPFLTKAISKNGTIPGLTTTDLKDIEFQTELILAKALTFQGNIKALELLKKLTAKAEKENNTKYELEVQFTLALFLTVQGDQRACDDILEKLAQKNLNMDDSEQLQLEWLFIMTLSNLFSGNYEKARNICYSALPLAKESRDYNLFALLKLLNGFFYQQFQHFKNAVTIYDEVAHYCSETKMATGALFSWYFAAEAELQTGNPSRAEEIAEKALDIAKKPNINNFIAAILLSRLIAEVKTIKGDYEGAQIYIENGIELAEKNNLYYAIIILYVTFGKIYQENAALKKANKEESSNYAYRLYTKALSTAEKIDNNYFINIVEKEITNLQTFCKLSGIALGGA